MLLVKQVPNWQRARAAASPLFASCFHCHLRTQNIDETRGKRPISRHIVSIQILLTHAYTSFTPTLLTSPDRIRNGRHQAIAQTL